MVRIVCHCWRWSLIINLASYWNYWTRSWVNFKPRITSLACNWYRIGVVRINRTIITWRIGISITRKYIRQNGDFWIKSTKLSCRDCRLAIDSHCLNWKERIICFWKYISSGIVNAKWVCTGRAKEIRRCWVSRYISNCLKEEEQKE